MKENFPDDEERREASAMQFNGRTEEAKEEKKIFKSSPLFPLFSAGTQSPGVFIIV